MKRDLGGKAAGNVPDVHLLRAGAVAGERDALPRGRNGVGIPAGVVLHGRATPPPEETSQMSPRQTKAKVAPSGDKAGAVAKRMASCAGAGGSSAPV